MGDPNRRIITLSHSAQMRRFTSDLLRVLKGQASKQLFLHEFPAIYERMLNKQFNPVEYGLCSLEDLLDEVPENTVVISKSNNVVTIGIPKREQTAEEIIRTKQFAAEVGFIRFLFSDEMWMLKDVYIGCPMMTFYPLNYFVSDSDIGFLF